jgi:vacuolar-type H+-ATPase subunit F/Vma7
MSSAAAIGDAQRLAGYALAGAVVLGASTASEIEDAWARLDEDTSLVVLTPDAHALLGERLGEHGAIIWAVVPS